MRYSDDQNVVVPNIVKVNINKDVLPSNCFKSIIFCPLELFYLMYFQITLLSPTNLLGIWDTWQITKFCIMVAFLKWLIHLYSYLQVTEGYLMQKVQNNLVQKYDEQGILFVEL
jgi:hypothetical protein